MPLNSVGKFQQGFADEYRSVIAVVSQQVEGEGSSHGDEAFQHLKSPDCKCMLLDVNMPRINGVELLLLMQAEDIHIPTIVMAGFEDYDEEEMKQFTNVVSLLHKPFDLDDALTAIKTNALPPSRI